MTQEQSKAFQPSSHDSPFFLDFATEIPKHIQLETAVQGRECIVYDGSSSKSVSD